MFFFILLATLAGLIAIPTPYPSNTVMSYVALFPSDYIPCPISHSFYIPLHSMGTRGGGRLYLLPPPRLPDVKLFSGTTDDGCMGGQERWWTPPIIHSCSKVPVRLVRTSCSTVSKQVWIRNDSLDAHQERIHPCPAGSPLNTTLAAGCASGKAAARSFCIDA
ncbi:hypothetical protein BDZ91DRAFT_361825 [Kalaharituber pfeilii]|nr:hypothetical protein BDZ91DRAFT_361825 [Kalaharituber pfeilii]